MSEQKMAMGEMLPLLRGWVVAMMLSAMTWPVAAADGEPAGSPPSTAGEVWMPQEKDIAATRQRIAENFGAVEDARRQASMEPTPGLPGIRVPEASGIVRLPASVDLDEIAARHRDAGVYAEDGQPELFVFVSLSIPERTLLRIGEQAQKAGAVVVFRGPKYGLRDQRWAESFRALEPLTKTGAEIQIHPELFRQFDIRAVPALVVAVAADAGCGLQQEAATCTGDWATVVGDVSLEYALEQLEDRTDRIGEIAKQRIMLLRNR